MDFMSNFRNRMKATGCNLSNYETQEATENFNSLLDNRLSPTVHDVIYVKREDIGLNNNSTVIRTNVTDVAKNDQKVNDEKYFDFKLDSNVKSGDQIYWHDSWWIIYHEEKNSVITHKTFTGKKCNFDYKFKIEGIEYSVPCQLVNLTMYSDGMADKTYMTNLESSRKIIMSDNSLSKKIIFDTRLMLTDDTVFTVAHIDSFTREGVRELILSQTFLSSKDDKDKNIAYNKNQDEYTDTIIGSDEIFLGCTEEYSTELISGTDYDTWDINPVGCVSIDNITNDICTLICDEDISNVGTKVELRLLLAGNVVSSKEIIVKGVF